MRHVCIVVQNYYDIDPRVRRKAEALISAGCSVDVVALQPRRGSKNYVLNGVHIYSVPIEKKRGSSLRYVFEYLAFFAYALVMVTALMLRRHYDTIDVNTLPDFLIFAAWPAKLMGASLVLDMHEIMPEFYMSKFGIGEKHFLIWLIRMQERLSMCFADHVITINEPIENLLASRGLDRRKSSVVMNSADESLLVQTSLTGDAKDSHGFVMMYHGTLTRIYGLDIAIRALNLVRDEMPDAQFWIVGDGPERHNLESLVGEYNLAHRVRFIGMVPQQEIPQWLRYCRIGVLPTRRDVFLDFSFSNKLPEYIISGKPVVVAKLKAISHYFSPAALMFFAPEDPEDLARQFVRLYRDPKLCESLAREARKEYEKINWPVMKHRYLDIILTRSQSNE